MDALIIYNIYKKSRPKNTKNHQYTTYIDDFYLFGIEKKYEFRDTYFFLDALRDARASAFFLLTSFVFQFLQ